MYSTLAGHDRSPQWLHMLEFLTRFCNDPPRFTTLLAGLEMLRFRTQVRPRARGLARAELASYILGLVEALSTLQQSQEKTAYDQET
jgi:hypothetical protein